MQTVQTFIDNVINNFQNAVNRVETILDNLKSAIIDYNEKLTDSSTGFSAFLTNMGHTPASNKFSDVKYAVKNVIRDIINGIANRSVTVGEAVQNLRKLIMGDGTHNGYLQVFQSYKNIERLKEQATFIKTVIEGYKNSLSDQISDVGSSFATLDKHFDIDTNTNQFQLDTLEKVQKLAQNVGSVIQEGTTYYRLVVAKAVADVVDQLSKKIGDAIDNIGEDSEVTTDSSDPSIKHVAAVENLMSDINTAKNNVTNLISDPNLSLNDFETLVTDKIRAGNEVTFVNNLVNSVTQSLQHLNVADITTTIEASDGDFANAFVAVKSYKNLIDTSSDYIEQRINEVANELSNHQNWQQVISRIDNSISQTVSRLESDATPILNYANGQLEDIENNVYSGVKNDIQNIVNKFNQDKQEYDNIASQILNLTSQLDDDNVDLEQLQSQIVQLAQQQQQIINDIATNWWNTIKNVYSRAHSQYNFYNNRYTPLRNKADDPTQDLSTQEYVNLANYEINTAAYWLEEQILNKLETVLNSLSHTYGSNTVQVQVDIDGGDGLSTEEAEVLLDEITSLAINLPDTLDGAADLVYPDTELDSNDINSIDITV